MSSGQGRSPCDIGPRELRPDVVKLALGRVFDHHGAEMVVIDPAVDNRRAIPFSVSFWGSLEGPAQTCSRSSAWHQNAVIASRSTQSILAATTARLMRGISQVPLGHVDHRRSGARAE